MTGERGSRAESKNCKILLLPTADRRFDTKFKCPNGQTAFWVKFSTVRSLTRVKCLGIARDGDGWFWNWLVHKRTLQGLFISTEKSSYKTLLTLHTDDAVHFKAKWLFRTDKLTTWLDILQWAVFDLTLRCKRVNCCGASVASEQQHNQELRKM